MLSQVLVLGFGDHLFDATQQMGVALPFGIFENVVAVQTIDDEDAVKRIAENIRGHVAAAAIADGVNRYVFGGKHPQPSVDATDAPTGFVGMHDVTLA